MVKKSSYYFKRVTINAASIEKEGSDGTVGGDDFPLTLPSPGIEEVLDSLRGVGIEAVPGESVDYVIAEEPDGKRYKLPRDFSLFTNPVMIPIEEK